MSLPLNTIDRIFARMSATYGRQWLSMWEGLDALAVKALWGHELSIFAGSTHRLDWALENLPERCPNVIQFKALCRMAPAPEVKQLPAPVASASVVKAEAKKQEALRRMTTIGNPDWHKAILARHAAGEHVTHAVLQMAQDVARRSLVAHGA